MTIRGPLREDDTQVLKVERPFYQQQQFNSELSYCKPDTTHSADCSAWMTNIRPLKFISNIFPFFTWMSQYNIRNDLVCDIISGCTVAVMHIPQGMGYAMLASVPPIVGIYTAFYPVLVYFFFGTSKHNSMGTFAVISIMVGKTVLKYSPPEQTAATMISNNSLPGEVDIVNQAHIYTPIAVATALTFVVACTHLTMYVLRLGIISTLLSETLVSGFTTGAACHVFTSQVKDLLGVSLTPKPGNFKIVLDYYEIITKIPIINWTAVIISFITITTLLINNEVYKPKLSKICIVPIPIELICVITGTLISQYVDLSTNYQVKIIGHIPTGLPGYQVPDFNLAKEVVVDGIIIGIVSYTVTVSMALIFAQKMNYEINFNQELLGMGLANIAGSFFSALPLSASLSRSAIQFNTGGRTQLASIVSISILACVLMWIGPFFQLLPKCVLASIIVVALKGLLLQAKQLFEFWKMSRLDAIVWLATFLTVVLVSIDIGLLVGIVFSLACIFIRGMKPYTCLLGHIPKTDLYLDITRYKAAEEIPSIKIYHYCGSLNFATRSTFKSQLISLLNLDLPTAIRRLQSSSSDKFEAIPLKCVIIDFSALSYVDPSAVSSLKSLFNDFNKLSINAYIAAASCPAYEMMAKCGLREKPDGSINFFPTINDAVHQALGQFSALNVITGTI